VTPRLGTHAIERGHAPIATGTAVWELLVLLRGELGGGACSGGAPDAALPCDGWRECVASDGGCGDVRRDEPAEDDARSAGATGSHADGAAPAALLYDI
jgi:hypothetical protein